LGPKRAVTVAPLPSAMYLKFRSRTFAAASIFGGRIQARHGVAGFAGELHAAPGANTDGVSAREWFQD
jgi:hypothetical protein